MVGLNSHERVCNCTYGSIVSHFRPHREFFRIKTKDRKTKDNKGYENSIILWYNRINSVPQARKGAGTRAYSIIFGKRAGRLQMPGLHEHLRTFGG